STYSSLTVHLNLDRHLPMTKVGIIGATGYTGVELVRLLIAHPKVKIVAVTSEKNAGTLFSEVFPAFQNLFEEKLISLDISQVSRKIEVDFLCSPHTLAMPAVLEVRKHG